MDSRLQGDNQTKIAGALGLEPGDFDVLNYAGPSLWMADPHEPSHEAAFRWQFENVCLNAHSVKRVGLVGHANCGGFALKGAPQTVPEEKAVIVASLQNAKAKLAKDYPQIEFIPAFVTIGSQPSKGLPEISVEVL
ncbi:MAG: hypothetical protein P4L74_06915 [Candidatus Doudnabacteria bacterium]|nr:hypothetical protein [Candidatus Doudnabacteria bacterium]